MHLEPDPPAATGACVEVAVWRKSSHSGSNGGGVEAARNLSDIVAARDFKDPGGPRLTFSLGDWRAFTARIKAGQLDLA